MLEHTKVGIDKRHNLLLVLVYVLLVLIRLLDGLSHLESEIVRHTVVRQKAVEAYLEHTYSNPVRIVLYIEFLWV